MSVCMVIARNIHHGSYQALAVPYVTHFLVGSLPWDCWGAVFMPGSMQPYYIQAQYGPMLRNLRGRSPLRHVWEIPDGKRRTHI